MTIGNDTYVAWQAKLQREANLEKLLAIVEAERDRANNTVDQVLDQLIDVRQDRLELQAAFYAEADEAAADTEAEPPMDRWLTSVKEYARANDQEYCPVCGSDIVLVNEDDGEDHCAVDPAHSLEINYREPTINVPDFGWMDI